MPVYAGEGHGAVVMIDPARIKRAAFIGIYTPTA